MSSHRRATNTASPARVSETVDADPDPAAFFEAFIDRAHAAPAYASALHAASLPHEVRAKAVRGIFTSMVDQSDNAEVMDRFLGLPCPKTLIIGEQNPTLSYLDHIRKNGVQLAEIPQCGDFPMYSNAPAMWAALEAHLADVP